MVYREQSENSSTESGTDTDLSPGLSFGLSGDHSIISGRKWFKISIFPYVGLGALLGGNARAMNFYTYFKI